MLSVSRYICSTGDKRDSAAGQSVKGVCRTGSILAGAKGTRALNHALGPASHIRNVLRPIR